MMADNANSMGFGREGDGAAFRSVSGLPHAMCVRVIHKQRTLQIGKLEMPLT